MKTIFIHFIFALTFPSLYGETLSLSYWVENDIIKCEAIFENKKRLHTANKDSTLKLSVFTYGIVEGKHHKQKLKFEESINKLSNDLLYPFHDLIENCSIIEITLDTMLLKIPFEYLHLKGKELSFYKPMIFKLTGSNVPAITDKTLALKTGTIIRDKSCDPQNACRSIKKKYPAMNLFSTKEKLPNNIVAAREDVLLISAHGYAYEKNRGVLGWNKIRLKSENLKQLNPKITYFDSCQQGINLNYLEALQETEDINYYIGPIISNDSGDSSTKTIEWFFDYLDKSLDPATALNQTKKKLNAHYKNKKKLTRYNKAYSFRVYVLD